MTLVRPLWSCYFDKPQQCDPNKKYSYDFVVTFCWISNRLKVIVSIKLITFLALSFVTCFSVPCGLVISTNHSNVIQIKNILMIL